MSGPELAAFAAEHVMGWERIADVNEDYWVPPGMVPACRCIDWSPHTDWNDARRVLLAVPHSGEIEDAAGMFMIDPNSKPEHLLRYVCEQWEANQPKQQPKRDSDPYTEPVPVEARLLEVKFFRGNAVQAWCHDHLGHGHPVKEIYPWYSNARKVMRMNPRVIINAENAVERICVKCNEGELSRETGYPCTCENGRIPSAIPAEATHVCWIPDDQA
jgi:hypothetical protein